MSKADGESFRGTSPVTTYSSLISSALFVGIVFSGTYFWLGPPAGDRRDPIDMVTIHALFAAGWIVLTPLFVASLIPTRLWVDAEGVRISWMWRDRFVPHLAIFEIAAEADGNGHPPRWLRIRHAGGTEMVGMPSHDQRARFLQACSGRRQALG